MRVCFFALCVLALGGCSEPAEPPPAREESVVEPSSGTEMSPEAAGDEAAIPAAPSRPAPRADPTQEPVEGATVELAIDPVPNAVHVVQMASHGERTYVLYTWDGAEVARSSIAAEPDGEFRLDTIEDGIDQCQAENDDYSVFGCTQGVAPDAYLAVERICEAHGWGVALVSDRGEVVVRSVRRSLFALSCDAGEALEQLPQISVRDLDGDGDAEVEVRMPIATVRGDANASGQTRGVLVYLLDEALRTQLRITSHYESTLEDVAGTTMTCRSAWRLADVDADGHDDVRIRATCTQTWSDEESGDFPTNSPPNQTREDATCLWTETSDTWVCDTEVGAWLLEGGSAGLLGEAPQDLGLSFGGALEERLAAARGEDEVDEPESTSVEAAQEPGSTSEETCVYVVEDPRPPLRVRERPRSRSDVVGELSNGVALELGERRASWAHIDAPIAGWVWTENLRHHCED